MYYVQCKNCGDNNDPGETCDCKRERPDYFRTTLKLGISGRWHHQTEQLLKTIPSVESEDRRHGKARAKV